MLLHRETARIGQNLLACISRAPQTGRHFLGNPRVKVIWGLGQHVAAGTLVIAFSLLTDAGLICGFTIQRSSVLLSICTLAHGKMVLCIPDSEQSCT